MPIRQYKNFSEFRKDRQRSHYYKTVLWLQCHSSPTSVAMQCHRGGRTLLLEWENFATEVGELCAGSGNVVI